MCSIALRQNRTVIMNTPKVSIITPTYNSEALIKACLASVATQSYANKEHLIIDNASTDKTVDIVRTFAEKHPHIHLVSEKDNGIYDALNKGIQHITGDWVLILGSDDTFFDNDVLKDVFTRQDTTEYDVIYGNVQWGENGKIYDKEFSRLKLIEKNICQQAIFYSSSLFSKFGPFETQYKILADWVFNMKWFNQQDIKRLYIDRIIATYNPFGYSSDKHDTTFLDNQVSLIEQYFPKEYSIIFAKERSIKELKQMVSVYTDQLKQREEENKQLHARVGDLEGIVINHERTIHKMLNSSSWRITKPLRKLSKSFRKRSRKIRAFLNSHIDSQP